VILREGTQDAATLDEVRAYRPLGVRAGDCALDLGGNVGAFGRVCADAGAAVVAFEPEPSNADLYRRNVPEARVVEAAFGKPGRSSLWLGSSNSLSIIQRRGREAGPTIPVVSLARALAEAPGCTLVKCDIEGSEYDLDWRLPPSVRGVAVELHFTRREWRDRAAPVLVRRVERQGFQPVKPYAPTPHAWHIVMVWLR
jgi:FkbM family methyltransferase